MKRTLLEELERDGLIRVICIQVDAPSQLFRQFIAEFARRQSMRELFVTSKARKLGCTAKGLSASDRVHTDFSSPVCSIFACRIGPSSPP
jgi:hypothetical protein